MCLAGFVTLIYFGTAPNLDQTQPIYGDIVYSPFSKINYRYNRIEATLDSESTHKYNLTICQTSCPLKTHTKQLAYNGSCKQDRNRINCHAKFSGDIYNDDFSQCYSKYMVKNSKITFKITESDLSVNRSVQLCITTNIDKCTKIFWPGNLTQLKLQQDCFKLITFDATDYSGLAQTFITPDDTYYCAIWLLGSLNQWLNYTVNLSIEMYAITDYSYLCKSYIINHDDRERHSHVTFPLTYASTPQQTMCIVQHIKITDRSDCNSYNGISVNSIALKPLNDTAWIAFIVIVGIIILLFCILVFFAIFFITLYLCICTPDPL